MFDKYTVSIYNLMQDKFSKEAIEKAKNKLKKVGNNFKIINSNFVNIKKEIKFSK